MQSGTSIEQNGVAGNTCEISCSIQIIQNVRFRRKSCSYKSQKPVSSIWYSASSLESRQDSLYASRWRRRWLGRQYADQHQHHYDQ